MKKTLSLFLAILMIASLVTVFSSCKKDDAPAPEPIEAFLVVAGKNDAATIVYAYNTKDGMNNARRQLAETLQQFIYDKTGTKPKVTDDRTAEGEGFEILIGETNRAASAAVKEEITNDLTYIIRAVDKKLVVMAKEFEVLEEAVNIFVAANKKLNYKVSTKDGTMSFKNGYNYAFTLPAVVRNVEHIGYVATALAAGSHYVVQGGCTDGTYLYACLEDQKVPAGASKEEWEQYYKRTSAHTTIIAKVDLQTMKPVKMSEPMHLDHSNDMAYNPNTNELVVVHCGMEQDRGKILSFIDPETLTLNKTIEYAFEGGYAMAYNASRNVFVTASGRYYKMYNGTYKNPAGGYWNSLERVMEDKSFPNFSEGHTTQGIDCDDDYIYAVLTGDGGDGVSDSGYGYLVITTWEGKLVTTCRIPLPNGETSEIETENIFHIGNTFYVVYNTRDSSNVGHVHRFTIEGLSRG